MKEAQVRGRYFESSLFRNVPDAMKPKKDSISNGKYWGDRNNAYPFSVSTYGKERQKKDYSLFDSRR